MSCLVWVCIYDLVVNYGPHKKLPWIPKLSFLISFFFRVPWKFSPKKLSPKTQTHTRCRREERKVYWKMTHSGLTRSYFVLVFLPVINFIVKQVITWSGVIICAKRTPQRSEFRCVWIFPRRVREIDEWICGRCTQHVFYFARLSVVSRDGSSCWVSFYVLEGLL